MGAKVNRICERNKSETNQKVTQTKQFSFFFSNFAASNTVNGEKMPRLKEYFEREWELPATAHSGIVGAEMDAAQMVSNARDQRLPCYTFSVVTQGRIVMVFNGREITFEAGDLFTYSPGVSFIIEDASDDCRALCLVAEEDLTLETPVIRRMLRAAYFPVVQLQEPKLRLRQEQADKLCRRMHDIIDCQHSDHLFRDDMLRLLYSTFLLDLLDILEHSTDRRHVSERSEELFIGFIRLLPLHFIEHHDIPFYADRLNITPIYLSRIVRQISGRTVVDYINQMLLMEASWLLQSTRMTIAQIAEKLHFSNHTSFIRFFTRMKGISPKAYRLQK